MAPRGRAANRNKPINITKTTFTLRTIILAQLRTTYFIRSKLTTTKRKRNINRLNYYTDHNISLYNNFQINAFKCYICYHTSSYYTDRDHQINSAWCLYFFERAAVQLGVFSSSEYCQVRVLFSLLPHSLLIYLIVSF